MGRKCRFLSQQKDRASDPANEGTIVIQVGWTMKDAPPGVKINQEEVRWEDLEQRLAQIYLKRAEKVAFVRGDSDIDFRYVADVIDLAYHAGVQRIGLLTKGQAVEGE